MNKYVVTIIVLLIASAAGFLFQQDRHRRALEDERSAVMELQSQIKQFAEENVDLHQQSIAAQREAEAASQAHERIIQAEDARVMNERRTKEEQREHRKQVTELLERLTQEAKIRKISEAAVAELNEKIHALETAQAEAEGKLATLEEVRTRRNTPAGEMDVALNTIGQRRAELARLEAHKQELEEDYQIILRRQTELKEKLMREATFSEDLRAFIEAFLRVLGF